MEAVAEYLHKHRRGSLVFGVYGLALCLLLGIASFSRETSSITSSRAAFWSWSDLEAMRRSSTTVGRVDTGVRSVVIVVVDALRHDVAYHAPTKMRALLCGDGSRYYAENYAPDVLAIEATAELPSFSVPARASLFSGAPPEMTGVVGDDNAPTPMSFDTVFGRVGAVGMHRVMVESEAAGIAMVGDVPAFGGWAVADVRAVRQAQATGDHWRVDELKVQLAEIDMMVSRWDGPEEDRTSLLYVPITHIDSVVHEYGVSRKYYSAVDNASDFVERLFRQADNNTVVVVVSDHGHADPGGHGGSEPAVLRIPIAFYRRGSRIGGSESCGDGTQGKYRMIDLAPTITALLGLPPPLQSQGALISDVLEKMLSLPAQRGVRRLQFLHTEKYVTRYVAATGMSLSESDRKKLDREDDPGMNPDVFKDPQAIAVYKDITLDIHGVLESVRLRHLALLIHRNAAVATAITFVLCVIPFAILQMVTACDPFSVVRCRTRLRNAKKNRASLLLSLGMWTSSCAIAWTFFLITERFFVHPWSGWTLSITMVSNRAERFGHFVGAFVSGLLAAFLVHAMVLVILLRRSKRTTYLLRHYSAAIGCCAASITLATASSTWVFFPGLLHIPYVTSEAWDSRFRSLIAMTITLPMTVVPVLWVLLWPYHTAKDTWLLEMARCKTVGIFLPTYEVLKVSRVLGAQDHFAVLDLECHAVAVEEIKRRYKSIAVLVHPDKCRAHGAEDAFKKVVAAYEQLSDPKHQAEYLEKLLSGPEAFLSSRGRRERQWDDAEAREAKRAKKERARQREEEMLESLRDKIEGRFEANCSAWSNIAQHCPE
eukprot:m51a1_g82 hypothetical protein (825) ;mRNA; f:266742-269561